MSEKKNAPVNTGNRDGGMEVFFDALLTAQEGGNPSDAILRQESRGQCSFVRSQTLPADNRGAKDVLEKAGVKFLEVVEGDPIFQYVELPDGWKKEPTDHSMWSKLVDDKGRTRAGIFYKAAFYDRSAHIQADRRFSHQSDYAKVDAGVFAESVTDGGKEIWRSQEYPFPLDQPHGDDYFEARRKAMKEAEAYLDANYPDWQNAAAYWDDAEVTE